MPFAQSVLLHAQVEAELTVARRQGCDVIREVVNRIDYPDSDIEQETPLIVHTDLGNVFYCRKVILATGAFTELRQLMPRGVAPNIRLITQSVIYAEMSNEDVKRMR